MIKCCRFLVLIKMERWMSLVLFQNIFFLELPEVAWVKPSITSKAFCHFLDNSTCFIYYLTFNTCKLSIMVCIMLFNLVSCNIQTFKPCIAVFSSSNFSKTDHYGSIYNLINFSLSMSICFLLLNMSAI